MTPSFRGESARKFAEKFAEFLGEISRSFSASFRGVSLRNLAEKTKSPARAYAKSRGVFSTKVRVWEILFAEWTRKKELFFSWADRYIIIGKDYDLNRRFYGRKLWGSDGWDVGLSGGGCVVCGVVVVWVGGVVGGGGGLVRVCVVCGVVVVWVGWSSWGLGAVWLEYEVGRVWRPCCRQTGSQLVIDRNILAKFQKHLWSLRRCDNKPVSRKFH